MCVCVGWEVRGGGLLLGGLGAVAGAEQLGGPGWSGWCQAKSGFV